MHVPRPYIVHTEIASDKHSSLLGSYPVLSNSERSGVAQHGSELVVFFGVVVLIIPSEPKEPRSVYVCVA